MVERCVCVCASHIFVPVWYSCLCISVHVCQCITPQSVSWYLHVWQHVSKSAHSRLYNVNVVLHFVPLHMCIYESYSACTESLPVLIGFGQVLFSADQQQYQLPPHGEWRHLTAVYWEQLADREQSIQLIHPVIGPGETPSTTFCLCQFPKGRFDMESYFCG